MTRMVPARLLALAIGGLAAAATGCTDGGEPLQSVGDAGLDGKLLGDGGGADAQPDAQPDAGDDGGGGECILDDDCDDGVDCTLDSCDSEAGCVFDAPAADGKDCTTAGGQSGTCEAGDCVAERPSWRMTEILLKDPHTILETDVSGCALCDDITDNTATCAAVSDTTVDAPAWNPSLNQAMNEDADGDGYLDLSLMMVFDPLEQTGSGDLTVTEGRCTDNNNCEPDPDATNTVHTTYTTQTSGTCLEPIDGTVYGGTWPDGTQSDVLFSEAGVNGCFVSDVIPTYVLSFEYEGNVVEIPLQDAQIGGTWTADTPPEIQDGLVMGFLTENDADNITLALATSAGEQEINLGQDLLPEADHCSGPDARDTHDGESGWWFYINYEAGRECVVDEECDDGDPCTMDSCDADAGWCMAEPVDCGDGVTCTIDSCDPEMGGCVNQPDDSLCDDGEECTSDTCDPASGCESTPVADGASCANGAGLCRDGGCDESVECIVDGNCADNECTVASCVDDACVYETDDALCDDGDVCNGTETCDPVAGCVAGTALGCDDEDPCTMDSCDADMGCEHSSVECDDGNECTIDSCDPATGCVNDATAADGNSCTTDTGEAGTCGAGGCFAEGTQQSWRMTEILLKDPHTIMDTPYSGCSACDDITNSPTECTGSFDISAELPAFNPSWNEALNEDADGDGYLDLSFMLTFDPFQQTGSGDLTVAQGLCTDNDNCEPDPDSADPVNTTYATQTSGTCLEPVDGTVYTGTWPDGTGSNVLSSDAGATGCFASDTIPTYVLSVAYGGNRVEIPLQDVQIGGTWTADSPPEIQNGLLTGFLTESDADNTLVSVNTALGTADLSLGQDLLPEADHCMGPDARDTYNAESGWWFYVNYSATHVANATGF